METAGYVVKASDLSPITDTLLANAGAIVPWGIGVVAIMVGIRFIPRLIKTFSRS